MISVKTAARIIGASERWVRSACERGILGDSYGDGIRQTHVVSPGRLKEWMGWTSERLEEELKKEANE